jgi:hypothetical protein
MPAVRPLCVPILLLAVALAGCRPSPSAVLEPSDGSAAGRPERPSPEATLEAMVRAYQEAPVYSDRGEIQLTYRVAGRVQRDSAPLAVHWERPGKLHVEAYQVELLGDGEKLRARMEQTGLVELDGQVVERAMPEELALSWLYEDHLLYEVLQRGLGRQPIQLELLLAAEPIPNFRAPSTNRRYLDDGTWQGGPCYRVEVRTAEGPFVFWIDQQQHLLRRLEYPTGPLQASADPRQQVTDLRLVAEFHASRFGASDSALPSRDMETSAGALRRFVRPPQPLPSNLFGQAAGPFTLYDLEEKPQRSEQWRGQVAVLHWYVDHPACQASLERFERVRRESAERGEDVLFLAVNADAAATPAEVLQQRMADWGFEVPILRDRDAAGRDVFDIHALPAVVILGPDGTVQFFETTYNPLLGEYLAEAIGRIMRGEDLGLAVVAQAHHDAVQYQKMLQAAAAYPIPTYPVSLTTPTPPRHLSMQPLWSCDELSAPGNLALVPIAGGGSRGWALQAGSELVELNLARGTVMSRHGLPVAPDEHLNLLRGTAGRDDQVWLVAAEVGGKRLYLCNDRQEMLWTAPPPELRHDGILDVQFVDLRGDGEPEVCVLLAGAGLVAWDLSGQEVYRADTLAGVSLIGAARPLRDDASPAAGTGNPREAAAYVAAENGRVARIEIGGHPSPWTLHPPQPCSRSFGAEPTRAPAVTWGSRTIETANGSRTGSTTNGKNVGATGCREALMPPRSNGSFTRRGRTVEPGVGASPPGWRDSLGERGRQLA